MEMLPKSQQHEISGLVTKQWTELTPEDKQYFEENALEDQERFKREMEEYKRKYSNRIQRSDHVSRQFVEKLRALEDASLKKKASDAVEEVCTQASMVEELKGGQDDEDIYESIADQAIQQILNLRKSTVKLIRQSRKKLNEEARA